MMLLASTARNHLLDKDLVLLCSELTITLVLYYKRFTTENLSALLFHFEVITDWQLAQHTRYLRFNRLNESEQSIETRWGTIFSLWTMIQLEKQLERAFLELHFFMAKMSIPLKKVSWEKVIFQLLRWDTSALHKGGCANLTKTSYLPAAQFLQMVGREANKINIGKIWDNYISCREESHDPVAAAAAKCRKGERRLQLCDSILGSTLRSFSSGERRHRDEGGRRELRFP